MYFPKRKQLNLKDVAKGVIVKTRKPRKPVELKTFKELVKVADVLFSKAVKKQFAINDICYCFTCDKPVSGRNLQAGHFISREFDEIRFEYDNCRPQCFYCNCIREGKKNIFEDRLRKVIGDERVDELKAIGLRVNKQDRDYLIAKIAELKAFLKK